MDMQINANLIRELRTHKAWSQDQLAVVSGLSIRTVQRIEKTGTCSLESIQALASVFEVDVAELGLNPSKARYSKVISKKYGFCGIIAGLIFSYIGITISLINRSLNYGEAGVYYGSIGAMVGICGAIIGSIRPRKGSAENS